MQTDNTQQNLPRNSAEAYVMRHLQARRKSPTYPCPWRRGIIAAAVAMTLERKAIESTTLRPPNYGTADH
jgi:hypothetical protein